MVIGFISMCVFKVITHEEAERRGKEYDASMHTYLFDLDYNDLNNDDGTANERQNWFTVDAAYYGNASHFINHSVSSFLLRIYRVFDTYAYGSIL